MRKWVPILGVLVAVSAVVFLAASASGQAAKKPVGQVGVLSQLDEEALPELKGKVMTMTLFLDGKPVRQTDDTWNNEYGYEAFWSVPPGIYDLRVEGEGAQTIVKRGILVVEDEKNEVKVAGEPGSGCKVVTYGTAELGRFGKSCGTNRSHLNASPEEWKFCPVCGKKLQ